MKVLALIPARSGSKGLPGKNIKDLNGKPLLAYSIITAKKAECFSEIIVSTDSQEIASIANTFGATTPFLRPEEFAADSSSDKDVIQHALQWYQSQGVTFDLVAYLRPTTPFKRCSDILNAIDMLISDQTIDSVRSVTKSEGVFHPYWMFKNENGNLKEFIKDINFSDYYQRQLLPECFRLNGVIDVFRTKNLEEFGNIYGSRVAPLIIDEKSSVDIDNMHDFKYAEFILKGELHEKNSN